MSDSPKRSRVNKYEKRRKNNKAISILFIIAIILAIVLVWMILFGENNNSENGQEEQASGQLLFTERENTNTIDDPDDQKEDITEAENEESDAENNDETKESDEIETTEVDSSDPNVIEAYTGNWEALGTEQEGPHTTVYADGSADRIEIKQAVLSVTGLSEDDFIEHWVGNGGDQKVISTVSNGDHTEIYRVYLSWIDGEGWEPTKVEKLKSVSR